MPAPNDLRKKAVEVQEVTSRLAALIEEVSPHAQGHEESEEAGEHEGDSDMAPLLDPEEEFQDSKLRVAELFNLLNVEGREMQLEEVSDWFHHRAPTARRDMQVLGQLDRDCVRRESERLFLSLSTSDKLRKGVRNAPKVFHTFCQKLGNVHFSEKKTSSQGRHTRSCDAKLTPMTDEEVEQAIVDLRADLATRELEALASVCRIEEEHQFRHEMLSADAELENPEAMLEVRGKKGELDAVVEQHKLLYYAKQSLRQIDARKDLFVQSLDYIKGKHRASADAVSSGTADMMKDLLEQKRKEVRDEKRPELLEQRKADHGMDVEIPSDDYVRRLREECSDIQRRINYANSMKARFSSDSNVEEALHQQLAELRSGSLPRMHLLDDFADQLEPGRDWRAENFQEEEPNSQIAAEGESLAKKEHQVCQQAKKISDEQNALYAELLRACRALKSQEKELEQIELTKEKTRDAIELLEDHRALVGICLACALGTDENTSSSQVKSPARRMTSKEKKTGVGQDIVDEFLGKASVSWPTASMQLQTYFHDSQSGLHSKETLSFQSEVLKQLESEEKQLEKEVQELSAAAEQRLQRLVATEECLSPARIKELSDADVSAKAALDKLGRTLKSLLPQQGKMKEPAPAEVQHTSFQDQKEAVDSSKATLDVLGRYNSKSLPKEQFTMREVVALEAENRELTRKLVVLAPETQALCRERGKLKEKRDIYKTYGLSVEDREYVKLMQGNRVARQQARHLEVMKAKMSLASQIKEMCDELDKTESQWERQSSA